MKQVAEEEARRQEAAALEAAAAAERERQEQEERERKRQERLLAAKNEEERKRVEREMKEAAELAKRRAAEEAERRRAEQEEKRRKEEEERLRLLAEENEREAARKEARRKAVEEQMRLMEALILLQAAMRRKTMRNTYSRNLRSIQMLQRVARQNVVRMKYGKLMLKRIVATQQLQVKHVLFSLRLGQSPFITLYHSSAVPSCARAGRFEEGDTHSRCTTNVGRCAAVCEDCVRRSVHNASPDHWPARTRIHKRGIARRTETASKKGSAEQQGSATSISLRCARYESRVD